MENLTLLGELSAGDFNDHCGACGQCEDFGLANDAAQVKSLYGAEAQHYMYYFQPFCPVNKRFITSA